MLVWIQNNLLIFVGTVFLATLVVALLIRRRLRRRNKSYDEGASFDGYASDCELREPARDRVAAPKGFCDFLELGDIDDIDDIDMDEVAADYSDESWDVFGYHDWDDLEGAPPRSTGERVEFAAFAPEAITPDSMFMLDVWAYLSGQYASVVSIAQQIGRDVALTRKTGVSVPRGEMLTITLEIEGLHVRDPLDTIVWDGVPTNASFAVRVPSDAKIGTAPGTAVIGYRGIAVAKLSFLVTVNRHRVDQYSNQSTQSFYPTTAFASYASENRAEVLSRIQGMKKVAPDLDIFVDVLSLRSGENWRERLEQHVPTKDTFYLFWSQCAARSVWVEREWRLALGRRGLGYIDPVPLEEPQRAPPPDELNSLHFSDAYLAYIKYYDLPDL